MHPWKPHTQWFRPAIRRTEKPLQVPSLQGFSCFYAKEGSCRTADQIRPLCDSSPQNGTSSTEPAGHQAAVAVMTVVAQPISFEFKGSRIKLVITALFLNELFMVASLDYPAVIHYHDDIGILYRR